MSKKYIKKYIAYGSNLNVGQMVYRCPDAKLIGTGYMQDSILLFRGGYRAGGVATVEPKYGWPVPSAVWKLSAADERKLDRYEGYPHLYYKKEIKVMMNNGNMKNGMIYLMDSRYDKPSKPSDKYVETIFQGYNDCELDIGEFYDALAYNRNELQDDE